MRFPFPVGKVTHEVVNEKGSFLVTLPWAAMLSHRMRQIFRPSILQTRPQDKSGVAETTQPNDNLPAFWPSALAVRKKQECAVRMHMRG